MFLKEFYLGFDVGDWSESCMVALICAELVEIFDSLDVFCPREEDINSM